MAQSNLTSILDQAPGSSERPKALPVGSYRCVIAGLPTEGKSSRKGTPFQEYTLVLQEPLMVNGQPDVDLDALDEVLTKTNGEKVPLQTKTLRLTFYTTDDALYRLEDFLWLHVGLDQREYKSIREASQDVSNREVGAYVQHQTSQDGTNSYAVVGRTFRIG